MDNYIMLNGKKIELTPEQIKLLQEDEPKSPFDRANSGECYYVIGSDFKTYTEEECHSIVNAERINVANYCTDENIMKQHALHMLLNNLLWKYSMTHGGDKIDWRDCTSEKMVIFYDAKREVFDTLCSIDDEQHYKIKYVGLVDFADEKTAKAAIEEIVKPFCEAHPDFDVTKM